MATSMLKIESPAATGIKVTDECLSAELADGRTISVPLEWFPRLVHATLEERENWDLSGAERTSTGRTSTRTSASRG